MTGENSSVSRPIPNPDFGVELVRDLEPQSAPKATLVLVHGIAEHSGRYERTGSLLAGTGFHVRSFDLRGAGASGGRRWDIEDWDLYLDQVERHLRWARSQERPVVLFGHSLGGTVALDYALGDRPQPDLLVLSAPALEAGARWQRAIAPLLARLAPTLPIPNRIKGPSLSRDPAVGEAYFADPLVQTSTTPRLGLQFFEAMDRVREGLHRLKVPTLVIQGGDDRLTDPRSTASLAEHQLVDRRLYPGLRHEVLNEPEGPQVVIDVAKWIESRL